jgi:hypothetical protein
MSTAEQLTMLRRAHEQLDRELTALRRKAHMTPSEERRSRVIRKHKLRTKDLIGRLSQAADTTAMSLAIRVRIGATAEFDKDERLAR